MNYKTFISFGLILIIFFPIYAQTYQINLSHVGYGKTGRYAVFIIRNTGETAIRDITILIDGEEHSTMKGIMGPGAGFEKILYLEPGEHLIEVRSSKGAYDSLSINILEAVEKPIKTVEELPFIKENNLYIGAGILIVILVIGIWLLMKKPKLE